MPLFSFSGQRPDNLGVKQGKLLPCPNTPNCVCSQADASDQEHSIEPITTNQAPGDAIATLKAIIEGMERSQINEATDNYLYAEFASKLMGFVDDMEFYVESGVIHVRSAARLGKSDLGVNRKRVETIRAKFQADS
ncbi:duf1499-containing protein [Leptolyngbya sp. Heron Island J]|uniref:DUF1499 domain-containing protein n=1 Tax=Leptolyngbya sp. Heron Island J TaxID=1385935 RepID=UPI0003B99D25|nr:DUF1499 domain-containing protein [Leptolyngbya sp. Heron Island J]ESA33236.1 duf1499-containing protein [Leptolyngbya sp. Heron Island J]